MKLYMIVETSEKEIPWFCGTSDEVAEILGYKNKQNFFCAMSNEVDFLNGLFRIEKVEVNDEIRNADFIQEDVQHLRHIRIADSR